MCKGNDHLSSWLRRKWEWLERSKPMSLLTALPVVGLVLSALALSGFGYLASEVLDKETEVFDTQTLYALRQLHTPNLDAFMKGITFLGEPSFLIVITIGFAATLLSQRQVAEAIALPVSALGATALTYLLKIVFARTRPELWQRIVDVNFYSFPSGHATISLVIYGLIGYLLSTYLSQVWQICIISLMVLLVLAIGFSRLYLGVHWPTDVIAGYAAGSVWLIASIFTLRLYHSLASSAKINKASTEKSSVDN
jgi:membrane-associated phospholipid phosphatase